MGQATDMQPRFPGVPSISAQWIPVYLEPLAGSGERLTVAIAARASDGEFCVIPTLTAKKAACMYGESGASITGFVELICESLRTHLDRGESLEAWRPPLRDTVSVGHVSEAWGDTVQQATATGAMLSASLAGADANIIATGETDGDTPDDGDDWVRQIRDKTVAFREDYRPRFLQRLPLSRSAPPTRIGYLGARLAAQFGRIIPGRALTNTYSRAKAYVTELEILRDTDRRGTAPRAYYELMVWLPQEGTAAYTADQFTEALGAFKELEAFTGARELQLESLADSAAAVARILHCEDA